LNIADKNNSATSLCAIGGSVTPHQFIVFMIIYFVPILFIVFRKYYKNKKMKT